MTEAAANGPLHGALAESRIAEAEARAAAFQALAVDLQARLDLAHREHKVLRSAYQTLQIQIEILRKQIFVAKAERVDSRQLELEFADKLKQLEELAGTLGQPQDDDNAAHSSSAGDGDGPPGSSPPPTRRPHDKGGRRNLRDLGLSEQRIELLDPNMEARVASGEARRMGFEDSTRLAWPKQRPSVLVIARQKYQLITGTGKEKDTSVFTTAKPPELIERCVAAPSLLAHIAVCRHCDGLPLNRISNAILRQGFSLDRGSMSRWMEELGGVLGATVVHAMQQDARANSFCVATDATGIRIHPGPLEPGQASRPCKRGHYFVQIADRRHIIFTYTERENSAAVAEMFAGYKGYVQADAKSVFDVLFRKDNCSEVGCWAHARRKFWESAFSGSAVAREALRRIGRIFELDASYADLPPAARKKKRDDHLRVHVNDLLVWADLEAKKLEGQRSMVRDALGYMSRQQKALRTFLDDGRLQLTNNGSERELRQIAVGRKAWMFFGTDGHASSAAGVMSVLASARLHGLNPQEYLTELIRVLPHWPTDRYLELSPAEWSKTRSRLSPTELGQEVGTLSVPPPPQPEEQGITN